MPNQVDAYLYSRVSTRRQLSGMGMELQDEDLKKCLSEHPEWVVKGTFKDLGISAYKGANRIEGEFGEFLKLVADGKIRPGSVLVVYSLDRISRDDIVHAQGLLLDLLRKDITVCTTIDRMVFSPRDNPQMVLMNMIGSLLVMVRANEESRTKSDRGLKNWAAKRKAAVDDGVGLSHNVRGWLDTDDDRNAVENKDKSRIVQRIFELSDMGHGYAAIMRRLDAEGKQCFGRSGRWSQVYIRNILTDRAVLGEKQFYLCNYDTDRAKVPVGEPRFDLYPRIISDELFNRVQAELARRGKNSPKGRNGRIANLFAGLCRCTACKGPLDIVRDNRRGRDTRYLRCQNRYLRKQCSEGGHYQYDPFERGALNALKVILTDDVQSTPKDDTAGREAALKERLANLERRHRRLYERYEDGDDDPILMNMIRERQASIAEAKVELSALESDRTLTARPERLARDQAEELIARALTGDKDARAEIARELRGIVSLVAFRPDGLIILEVANGLRFLGFERGTLSWIVGLAPETHEMRMPIVLAPGWSIDGIIEAVELLENLNPTAKPDIEKAVRRTRRERERAGLPPDDR